MSDLEKLIKTFNEIGIEYKLVDDGIEQILEVDDKLGGGFSFWFDTDGQKLSYLGYGD